MKMQWRITSKTSRPGLSVITYESEDGRWILQSRKRDIPHAASKIDGGTWQHTTYFLISKETGAEKEFWRRMDAVEAAEKLTPAALALLGKEKGIG